MKDHMEVCPLSRGVMLLTLNPYPSHYSPAFAFSTFLYPHFHHLNLRSPYLFRGEIRAYRVPFVDIDRLGALCPPVVFGVSTLRNDIILSPHYIPLIFGSSL